MIYRSNLLAPDFSQAFPYLHVRPMPHSFGHSVPSDWADKPLNDPVFGLYKNCGMLTHDEAAIVFNISHRHPGLWLDIGSHTGWSTAHLGSTVIAVDPMYGVPEFRQRAYDNLRRANYHMPVLLNETSRTFFDKNQMKFAGVMIDGDHSDGEPQQDAKNALAHLKDDGVIIFHDFIGRPVREAVQILMAEDFQARVYITPHMMAVCWRGEFRPPDHQFDPRLGLLRSRIPDFDLARCA
jgi:hypothetical protein